MDIVTYLRTYDYAISLARGSKWTLEEAVDYLAAYRVNFQKWLDGEDAYKGFLSIRDQLTKAVQDALDSGWLNFDEVYKEGSHGGQASTTLK